MSDQDTLHSTPTVATPKAPTLPALLIQEVETDRRLTGIEQRLSGIEQSQWYLLAFFALVELIAVGGLAGVVYLIGHLH